MTLSSASHGPNWVHQSWTHALTHQIPRLGGTLKYPPICPPARKLRPTVSQHTRVSQAMSACVPPSSSWHSFVSTYCLSHCIFSLSLHRVSSKGLQGGRQKGFKGVVKGVSRGSSKGFIPQTGVWAACEAAHARWAHRGVALVAALARILIDPPGGHF